MIHFRNHNIKLYSYRNLQGIVFPQELIISCQNRANFMKHYLLAHESGIYCCTRCNEVLFFEEEMVTIRQLLLLGSLTTVWKYIKSLNECI